MTGPRGVDPRATRTIPVRWRALTNDTKAGACDPGAGAVLRLAGADPRAYLSVRDLVCSRPIVILGAGAWRAVSRGL
jgi:hypothetical protein